MVKSIWFGKPTVVRLAEKLASGFLLTITEVEVVTVPEALETVSETEKIPESEKVTPTEGWLLLKTKFTPELGLIDHE